MATMVTLGMQIDTINKLRPTWYWCITRNECKSNMYDLHTDNRIDRTYTAEQMTYFLAGIITALRLEDSE